MVCRFMTPLKEAPVWNVLITSICKESESETALLHSQREVKKEARGGEVGSCRVRGGGVGKCWEEGTGAESKSEIPSYTKQQ